MRIGLIAPPWVPVPPTTYGGTELIVDLLARGLAAGGHEVVLWTTGDATCPVDRRWVHVRPPRPMSEAVPEAFHVLSAYEAMDDVDLVHDHTTLGPLLARQRPGLPVVATSHGPFTEQTRKLYAAAAGRVHLVAVSHAQALSAQPDVEVDAVIPHGLDVDAFPVGAGDGGYALFLGRMTPEKGVHVAIDAARRAGVPILVAAKCREDAEQAYFDEAVRPRLGPDAEYLGEVGGAEKLALLGGARVLVNPIRWPEPFGLVMAEALACGTPVVAGPHGAAPEIVAEGRTGFLCEGVEALAEAIHAAAGLDRSACRRDAEERLSVGRMVAEHEALYAALLAEGTLDLGAARAS